MLLQKTQIGKTAVVLFIFILLATLAAMPLFLQADSNGDATTEDVYLPVIYNEGDGTPDPGTEATPTAISTATNTATATATPTASSTSIPWCNVRFAQQPFGNSPHVKITGDVGIEVIITNLTTNEVIGSGTINGPIAGQDCPGFSYISVSPRLDASNVGHMLQVQQTDNADNSDTAVVLDASNPQPTNTPNAPYLVAVPNCGPGPDVQFKVEGYNWPIDQTLTLSWEGVPQVVFPANEHSGFFILTWMFEGLSDGVYTVSALSGTNGISVSDQVYVPCDLPLVPTPGVTPSATPSNTPTPEATSTPSPPDLIAISPPTLLSTPPIVAYQPVQFSVIITNTGEVAVEDQFFVDVYLDPTNILTDRIPLAESDGYAAVSSLAGGASRVITITSPLGFTNNPTNHQVYGMVDSVWQISETSEINNVTDPLPMNYATPGSTPIPTAVPPGTETISGVALVLLGGNFLNQERMLISAIDQASGQTVAVTFSDENGFYQFDNLTDEAAYTVTACLTIDNNEYFGIRTNRTAPEAFANIFANEGPCQ